MKYVAKFTLPQKCCVCLAGADTTLTVTDSYRADHGQFGASGTLYTEYTYSLDVPFCLACSAKRNTRRLLYWVLLVGSMLLGVAAAAVLFERGDSVAWVATIGIGGTAGALLGFGLNIFVLGILLPDPGVDFPVDFQQGRPRFKNKEFQALFDQANPTPSERRGTLGEALAAARREI